jgi:AP2 domain
MPKCLIPLTQGQNAIVDASDFDWLSQWKWWACWSSLTRSFYAVGWINKKRTRMHRLILGCVKRERCDHRNRDTLDNRRQNLRKATHAENIRNRQRQKNNTSGFKGVTWDEYWGKWRVRIGYAGRRIHIGRFQSAKEAAHAYDDAAKKLHGEFACLNCP